MYYLLQLIMVLSGRGDQSFSIQVQWLQHPQEEIHHLYAFILTNALQPNVQWACNSILENYFSNQAGGGVNEWMTKKKIHIAIYCIAILLVSKQHFYLPWTIEHCNRYHQSLHRLCLFKWHFLFICVPISRVFIHHYVCRVAKNGRITKGSPYYNYQF